MTFRLTFPAFARALLVLASLTGALDTVARDAPNIVLIVADDVGYSDFGAFGGEIETPHIDALASAGMRFSSFHAASSCAPTRAMLLTGVDSHLAGVGSMRELMPLSHRGEPGYLGVLNDRVRTVASLLREGGYRTSVAGKWHLGHDAGNLPPARGFDYSFIQADSGSDNFEMRPYLPMTPEARWYENGRRLAALPPDFYSSTFFVDKTIDFVEAGRAGDAPFFAYVAFQANHTPLQSPAEFVDRYRGRYTQGWAKVQAARVDRLRELGLLDEQASVAPGPAQAAWEALGANERYFEARRMQAYAGMATAMDSEIGRLVAYLREIGEYDNTVFLLLSDNGASAAEPYDNPAGRRWLEKHYHREVESLGEKGSWVAAGRRWGAVSNTPLDGFKFYAGEGGVRVPLIVSGPPVTRPGAIYREFAYVTDIAPTVLEIAGLEKPAPEPDRATLTGRSLLSALRGASAPVHPASEATGYEFSGNAALYRGDYKLVRNQPPLGDRTWRLFDIARDPGETTDLAGRMPEMFEEMRAQYDDWAERTGVLPMPENYELARQVGINTLLFFYLPRYAPWLIAAALLVVAAVWLYRRRRARG